MTEEYPEGNHKLKKRFENLKIAEHEPQEKKQKMGGPCKHNCEKDSPEFIDYSEPEELCCSCREVAVDPHTAKCGHTYGGVLVKLLVLNAIDSFNCSGKGFDNEECGEIINTSELRPDKALALTLKKKQVRCINQGLGCKHTMPLRKHKAHLTDNCQYEEVPCPSCTLKFKRIELASHQAGCESKTCAFSALGCTHVISSSGASSSSSIDHETQAGGLHMGLLYQAFSTLLAIARFSAKTLEAAMTQHTRELVGYEEALHMMNSPDQMRTDAMNVQELRTNYVNKRVDAKNHIERYNHIIHHDFPIQVAEPVFKGRMRSQFQERQEEERNEDVKKILQDINEIPILLNQGSIIFKVTNFSAKRTQAIKGDLKRGVHGPQFYTHEFGYLMVPILYPNGDGSGSATHLSIFIAIKKGKYDALLRWPLIGRITISILSQRRVGREAVRHSFRTDVASLSYHRPASDMNQASGIPKALDIGLLRQPSDYLVDDNLFIQIVVDPHLPDK